MNEDVTNSPKDWEDFWNSKPDGHRIYKRRKRTPFEYKIKVLF